MKEYTFIVDLSSWTQRARRRCSRTTGLGSGRGGGGLISSPKVEKHSRGLYTLHLQEGEGCWRGPCLHFVAGKQTKKKKRVKCTWLEPQTSLSGGIKTNQRWPNSVFIYRGPDAQTQRYPSVLVVSALELYCLSVERVFLCLFSACVTAKVQITCGSCFFPFSSQQEAAWERLLNGLQVITKSAWTVDNELI